MAKCTTSLCVIHLITQKVLNPLLKELINAKAVRKALNYKHQKHRASVAVIGTSMIISPIAMVATSKKVAVTVPKTTIKAATATSTTTVLKALQTITAV